jgi:hypothetical protein
MTEPNLLKLAKKGKAKALTAILNQSLQPKSVTAKVNRKDDYLQILLESAQTPDQEAMVSFIRKGLIKLEIESIQTVKVYGRKTGEESPAWSKKFELASPPEMPSNTEETDSENLSSYQTFRAPKSSVTPNVDTPPSTGQTDFQNPQRSSAMSTNPTPPQPIAPLSVGNVVSAGLRLYRDHFKSYFGVAIRASLWSLLPFLVLIPIPLLLIYGEANPAILLLLIPIGLVLLFYGMAKSTANSVLISRLAFGELVNKPESVREARRHVMPRMWSFLWAVILVGLIYFGIALGAMIVFAIVGGVIAAIVGQNTAAIVVFALLGPLLGVISFIAFIVGYIWLFSRLFIVEVPLAIENNLGASSAIGRSWKLTEGLVLRLIGVVFVAFLVTIPISIVVQIISTLIQPFLATFVPQNTPTFFLLLYLLILPFSFATGSLLIPFWQAIKAVVYYDLRTRKEGLGLEIHDSR